MKIAIVGAGKLGTKLIQTILSGEHSITIIDKKEDVINNLSNHYDVMTMCANAKSRTVLEECDIKSYDYLVAVTGSDESNLLISKMAKKLGCKRTIARVRNPEHIDQLPFLRELMEVDYIVNPDLTTAMQIYKYLAKKYTATTAVFFAGKVSMCSISAANAKIESGTPVSNIKDILGNIILAAISKKGGKVIIPKSDTVISEGDELFIVGETEQIQTITAKQGKHINETNINNVMLLGGGKTAFFLGKMLLDFGINVKIIDNNRERCQYLSSHLDDAMVLLGDATDLTLLTEENIANMDAVVTCTGFDEENLLLALTAKNYGVSDVIAKISRESYAELIGLMEIDMTINPVSICITNIMRYLHGSADFVASQLIQGQAQILEVLINEKMRICGNKIKSVELPKGTIIGAINRGAEILIPDGNTSFKKGDRVIIVSMLDDVPEIERFFSKK